MTPSRAPAPAGTQRREMSEAKKWRAVAEKIDAIPRHLGTFLCWHADDAMCDRVKRHLEDDQVVMLDHLDYPDVNANTDDRVLAALFLALEAEDDAKKLRSRSPRETPTTKRGKK